MFDKQQILSSIKALAKKSGRAPSRSEFISHSGITLRSVLQWFSTWNDAVRAAGLRPYARNARIDDRRLLEDWAKVVRKTRTLPPRRVYLLYGKYDPCTLAKRFGGYSSLPAAFRDFAKGKREWGDVLALVPAFGDSGQLPKERLERINNSSASALPPCNISCAVLAGHPVYGNPIPFPWLQHEPTNEQGVVLLFGMLAEKLGYIVENVQKGFPDCEAKRRIAPDRWQRVRIEFEFESKNFRDHAHPIDGCDLIVCWRHNWPDHPKHLEILDLSRIVKSSPNSRP